MSELKLIPNFLIDHDILEPGVYISRIDGDITTYDIRMKAPNQGDYLTNSAIHTIEHIISTYVSNSEFGDNIVFFGPSGSRTGFYLITKRLTDNYSIQLIKDAFAFVAEFWGRIPGASNKECGNCLEHNLPQAKEESRKFLEIIKDWTKEDLKYPVSEEE